MTKHIQFSPPPAQDEQRLFAFYLRAMVYLFIMAVSSMVILRTVDRVPVLAEFSQRAEMLPLMQVSLRLGEAWERSVATAPSVISQLRNQDFGSYVRDWSLRPEDLTRSVQDLRMRFQTEARDWTLQAQDMRFGLDEWRIWPMKQIATIEYGLSLRPSTTTGP